MARCMGRVDLFVKWLKMFKKDNAFERLTAALDAGDVKEAFEAAHALKGTSGNLGMKELYEADCHITDLLRGDGDLEAARAYYPVVKCAYDKILDLLDQL